MKKIVLFLFLSIQLLVAQEVKKQAQNWVKTLASPEFAGRGYTDEGMHKAAQYLASEYQRMGLKKVRKSYFQEFSYPVNILKTVDLIINGQSLAFGKDYLIAPSKEKTKQTYQKIGYFDHDAIRNMIEKQERDFMMQEIERLYEYDVVVLDTANFSDTLIFDGMNGNAHYQNIKYFMRSFDYPVVIELTDEKLTASITTSPQMSNYITLNINDLDLGRIEEIKLNCNNEYTLEYPAQNLIGMVKGESKDSIILVSAHYDHLGKVNDVYFPGANDNASGVSMLLSLADYYTKNKPKYNMYFVCFAGEEAGLEGSKFLANSNLLDLTKVKFMLNLDIMGTGDDGIQVVNGSVHQKEFELMQAINKEKELLKQVRIRGESCNSDHCPFHLKGVKSFFVYTLGGVAHYHDVYDKSETLPLTEFEDIRTLFIEFFNQI